MGIRQIFRLNKKQDASAPIQDLRSPVLNICLIRYNQNTFNESQLDTTDLLRRLRDLKDDGQIIWVNITGLNGRSDLLQQLRQVIDINPMVLKYISKTQNARFDTFNDFQLLQNSAFKMIDGELCQDNITFIIGTNLVITFQSDTTDLFASVQKMLRSGDLRSYGIDYLIYTFIDTIISSYHGPSEQLAHQLDRLEEEVIRGQIYNDTFVSIHRLGRQLLAVYRAIWHERDALTDFIRGAEIVTETKYSHFLRSCYDHLIELIEMIDVNRDTAKNLMNTYLSTTNNRMNEAMKVLSIMVSVFAPITTIASIYGMNFHFMPELDKWWGYPAALGAMIVSSILMASYFRYRGYVGRLPSRKR